MNLGFGTLSFRLRQFLRGLWFLPAALSLLAVTTIVSSYYAARFAPDELPFVIERGGVEGILTILGSSMLTVAVFSLSTIVNAISGASDRTTPRAVPLIMQDRVAQTSISVFVGAFLFSVVGIIGLSSGIYSDAGRLVLFFVTLLVVGLVVAALIRWIGRISNIGRTTETIKQVERAAERSMRDAFEDPLFGGVLRLGPPIEGRIVRAGTIGYLQHFDAARLAEVTGDVERSVHVMHRPGAFLTYQTPLVVLSRDHEDDDDSRIRSAFVIGHDRTFENDPGFGLAVLGSIASKALSPAINDVGTAIDVLGALIRVLMPKPKADDEDEAGEDEPRYPQLTISAIAPRDLLQYAFRPIARDGADKIEVVQMLQDCLRTLGATPRYHDAAEEMLDEVRARALDVLSFEGDRQALDEVADAIRNDG